MSQPCKRIGRRTSLVCAPPSKRIGYRAELVREHPQKRIGCVTPLVCAQPSKRSSYVTPLACARPCKRSQRTMSSRLMHLICHQSSSTGAIAKQVSMQRHISCNVHSKQKNKSDNIDKCFGGSEKPSTDASSHLCHRLSTYVMIFVTICHHVTLQLSKQQRHLHHSCYRNGAIISFVTISHHVSSPGAFVEELSKQLWCHDIPWYLHRHSGRNGADTSSVMICHDLSSVVITWCLRRTAQQAAVVPGRLAALAPSSRPQWGRHPLPSP